MKRLMITVLVVVALVAIPRPAHADGGCGAILQAFDTYGGQLYYMQPIADGIDEYAGYLLGQEIHGMCNAWN